MTLWYWISLRTSGLKMAPVWLAFHLSSMMFPHPPTKYSKPCLASPIVLNRLNTSIPQHLSTSVPQSLSSLIWVRKCSTLLWLSIGNIHTSNTYQPSNLYLESGLHAEIVAAAGQNLEPCPTSSTSSLTALKTINVKWTQWQGRGAAPSSRLRHTAIWADIVPFDNTSVASIHHT